MANWKKFIREVHTRKPLTFKYFKVWEKLTGYSEEIDIGDGVGDGEEEYEEVKREEISKEEYEKNKVEY